MKHIYLTPQTSTGLFAAHRQPWWKAFAAFLLIIPFFLTACMEDDFEGELSDVCPKVESITPADQSADVPLNTEITASFNKKMASESFTTSSFTVSSPQGPVQGSVSYADQTATFVPDGELPANSEITARITTDVHDLYDFMPKTDYEWSFTTTSAEPGPQVISTEPYSDAGQVFMSVRVYATFDKEVDPGTLDATTFSLLHNGESVEGTINYQDQVAEFIPGEYLEPNTTYTASLSAEISDPDGNQMGNDFEWNFTTGRFYGYLPNSVDMETSGRFAIFTGDYITNLEGNTEITGDVGIYPGIMDDITGFPPAIVVEGEIFATGDALLPVLPSLLTRANQNITDAYQYAVGADDPSPETISGDQGGVTLTPGIYDAGDELQIMDGDLVLDAEGDPHNFWIFKVGSTLHTGASIVLEGGAHPRNVFWQVGDEAIIGANTDFKGTILAMNSITLEEGASVTGRLMVIEGGVTLENTNYVMIP
ncbi:MAG: ice-binding family protein [Bacteroidales bacterium]